MKGQAGLVMMVLLAGILVVASSIYLLASGSGERDAAERAARDGAENALAALSIEYGFSAQIKEENFDSGLITLTIEVRNLPDVENIENIIVRRVRSDALSFIMKSIWGGYQSYPRPVSGKHYTYDVAVVLEEVTR